MAEVDVSVAILNVIVIRGAADHETTKKWNVLGWEGDGGELFFLAASQVINVVTQMIFGETC